MTKSTFDTDFDGIVFHKLSLLLGLSTVRSFGC